MNSERLVERLAARAPGAWELYEKRGESRELSSSPASRCEAFRKERGWAARWWDPAPRFAAATSAEELEAAILRAEEVPAPSGQVPDWPADSRPAPEREAADVPRGKTGGASTELEAPPDLFEELTRLVSAESRGQARLSEISVRRGRSFERVRNARGLDVSWGTSRLDGRAAAIGRRGTKACESRLLFRWDAEPDLSALARRLCDRATLPLSDRTTPIERGEWLLDPSVAASLLAALSRLFVRDNNPRWTGRGPLLPPAVSIVDDATSDAPYDGEGVLSRRVLVVESGVLKSRLHDLASARSAGAAPTGHGVRHSYRTPPTRAPRRLFFETDRPVSPRDLLASVRRGLFASALTAPISCDLGNDRYEAEFTGVAVVAGRAHASVAGARARGRLSELLRRFAALSSDRQFFPAPDPVGAPTLLIERASFE